MFPIQPVGWQHYLQLKSNLFPKHIKHSFYMSWEDAVWDLLVHLEISAGATVLVPEFFCIDVIENMAAHGLQAAFYPVDRNFQTDPRAFKECLTETRPAVVVILHAVGITNQLFAQKDIWLDALSPKTLLIEDSVHRVVDPSEINLISPRHVIIDSLRKVVPLPGSNLFMSPSLNLSQTPWYKTLSYQLQVIWLWLAFQVALILGENAAAEGLMLRGYDLTGDSKLAGSGWGAFARLARHIDHQKIRQAKTEQVALYQELLKPLWHSKSVFEIKFPSSDAEKLRGFPIGFELEFAAKILQKLRSNGLLTRFELNDSPWSTRQKVIYLPLGPHLTGTHIRQVANILSNIVL